MPSTYSILAGIAALTLLQAPASTDGAGSPKAAADKPRLVPPTAEDMDDFFPAKAALDGVGGRATIHCAENTAGYLSACRLVSEAPEGYGFGDAALKLSARMHMTVAEAGRAFDVTIRFQDPPPFREPRFGHEHGFEALGGPGPYYPDRAARNGVGGVAIIECLAKAPGRLQSCRSVLESPPGTGFEEAALKMAERGYLTVDPRPSPEDELVRIKVMYAVRGRR